MIKWKEAKALMNDRAYQKALRIYQTALKKEGIHPHIYFEMGTCYLALDKLKKANEFFEKGLEVLEDDTDTSLAHYYYVYSVVLKRLENLEKAYDLSRRSVLLKREAVNLGHHAILCFDLGFSDKAISTLAYCALKSPQDEEVLSLVQKYQNEIQSFWGTSEALEKKLGFILNDFPDGNRLKAWIIDGSAVQQDLYFLYWGELAQALVDAEFDISSVFFKRLCSLAFASSQVGSLFDFFASYFQEDFPQFLHLLEEWELSLPVKQLKESATGPTLVWLHSLTLFLVANKKHKQAFQYATDLVNISPLSVDGYIAQAEVLLHQKKEDEATEALVKAGMLNKKKVLSLDWDKELLQAVTKKITEYWKLYDKKDIVAKAVAEVGEKNNYTSEEQTRVLTFLTSSRISNDVPVFYHWHRIARYLVEHFFDFDDAVLLRVYWGAFEKEEHLGIFQFLYNSYSENYQDRLGLLTKTKISVFEVINRYLEVYDYQEKTYNDLVAFLQPKYEKEVLAHYKTVNNHSVWTNLLVRMGDKGIKTLKKTWLSSPYETQKLSISFEYEHSLLSYLDDEKFTEELIAKRIAVWVQEITQQKKMKNALGEDIESFLCKGKLTDDFYENLQNFAKKFSYQTDCCEFFFQDIEFDKDSLFYQRLLLVFAHLDLPYFLLEINESTETTGIVTFFNERNIPKELLSVYFLQADEKEYFFDFAKDYLPIVQISIPWLPNKIKSKVFDWLWEQFGDLLIPWFLEEGINMGVQIRTKIVNLLNGNICAYQYAQSLLKSKKQSFREAGMFLLMNLQEKIFQQLAVQYKEEKSDDLSGKLDTYLTKHEIRHFKESQEEKEEKESQISVLMRALLDKDQDYNF